MIQTKKDKAPSVYASNFYLNLFDKMTTVDNGVLMTITSQLTGNSKTFLPTTVITTNKDRYLRLTIIVSNSDNLSLGILDLGNTDFPLGFYDVTIYENSSAANLDPSGLNVVYTGLLNLSSMDDTRAVTYTEYTTNDADTESVYITI
tara:strand:+ start:145 stop:585 length:441 start_codon:yes stop_codon:yes gene_type:complete